MNCNWCGDEIKEGVWENHKCLEDKEDNVVEMFSNIKAYTPTFYYADTKQYHNCFGACEEVENNRGKENWYIMRCLYCHADKLPCLGITQSGMGCRRTTNLGDNGLCSQHRGR